MSVSDIVSVPKDSSYALMVSLSDLTRALNCCGEKVTVNRSIIAYWPGTISEVFCNINDISNGPSAVMLEFE